MHLASHPGGYKGGQRRLRRIRACRHRATPNSCSWRSMRRVHRPSTATSARAAMAVTARAGVRCSAGGSRSGRAAHRLRAVPGAIGVETGEDPSQTARRSGAGSAGGAAGPAAPAEQAARADAAARAAGKRRASPDGTPNKGGQRKDAPPVRELRDGEGSSTAHSLLLPPSQVEASEVLVAEAIAMVEAVQVADAADAMEDAEAAEAA